MDADGGTAARLQSGVARWLPAGALALAGVALLAPDASDGWSVALGLVFMVVALGFSPLFYPRSLDDSAARAEAARRDVPAIYWRPGCTYCFRMRIALGWLGRKAVWVDVSRDDRASARVREVNAGNETVPTVFVGEDAHTNPPPGWVRAQLTA